MCVYKQVSKILKLFYKSLFSIYILKFGFVKILQFLKKNNHRSNDLPHLCMYVDFASRHTYTQIATPFNLNISAHYLKQYINRLLYLLLVNEIMTYIADRLEGG